MYVLALLFGIVNFYFLLSVLIVILSLFTEYVQVPLINWGAKLFNLPINYTLERNFSHGSNTNVFNTVFNQEKNKIESDTTDDSDIDDDNNNETNETNTNDSDNKTEDSDDQDSQLGQQTQPDQQTQQAQSNHQVKPEHQTEQTQSSVFLNPEPIIIDETLD